MSNVKQIVAVIDQYGIEALYVDSQKHEIDGSIICAIDIVEAAGGEPVVIRQHELDGIVNEWPARLEDIAAEPID